MEEDLISSLPDECIAQILSSLTIKDAAKTSVLSTRWRYLWTQINSLNFDGIFYKNTRAEKDTYEDVSKVKILNYVNLVYKICSLIHAPTIQSFKIPCKLDKDSENDINKWIEYATEKKVKTLELIILLKSRRYILNSDTPLLANKHLTSLNLKHVNVSGELLEHFLLQCPLLEQISIENSEHLITLKVGVGFILNNLKILEIIDCFNLKDFRISAPNLSKLRLDGPQYNIIYYEKVPLLYYEDIGRENGDCLIWEYFEQTVKRRELIIPRKPAVKSNIACLTSLNLNRVNISEILLEHFLLHCTSLEQISITRSMYLRTLKVGVGVVLNNLKALEILHCLNLKDLHICAPRLSKFRYRGSRISLNIENAPSLRDLYIGWAYLDPLTWAFFELSSHLSRIWTLELYLQLTCVDCESLTRLEQLWKLSSLKELTVQVNGPDCDAFLYLRSLLKASPFLEKFKLLSHIAERKEEAIEVLCSLEHLKVIEIVGIITTPNGLKFTSNLLKAAIRLEKLVIDPVPIGVRFSSKETRTTFVWENIERLRSNVPEWTQFVL